MEQQGALALEEGAVKAGTSTGEPSGHGTAGVAKGLGEAKLRVAHGKRPR